MFQLYFSKCLRIRASSFTWVGVATSSFIFFHCGCYNNTSFIFTRLTFIIIVLLLSQCSFHFMFHFTFYVLHFSNILLWFSLYIINILLPSYLFLVSRFSFHSSIVLYFYTDFYSSICTSYFYSTFDLCLSTCSDFTLDIFMFFIFLDLVGLFIDIIFHKHS